MNKKKGIILAVAAGVFWGVMGVVAQYLFSQKGVTALWLVPYRMVIAGVILLVYLKIKKMNIFEVWKTKDDRRLLLVYSVLGMLMVQLSFFMAVQYSNAATATVLQYLNPVMMMVYFAVSRKILPRKNESVMLVMALVGVILVATKGDVYTLALSPMALLWGTGCAFFTCIYSALPMRLLKKYDPKIICGWGMLAGGVVMLAVVRPWTMGVKLDRQIVMSVSFLIVFGTIVPFCCSLLSIPLIGPIKTNLISSVEPVVAAVLTFFLLGTKFSGAELMGFALIIATIFVFSIGSQT